MSRMFSKVQLKALRRWQPPAVDSMGGIKFETLSPIQQQIYQDGYDHGHQIGVQQGTSDAAIIGKNRLSTQVNQMDNLLRDLQQSLNNIDDELVAKMGLMVTAISKQLVRREIKTDQKQVIAAIQEVLAQLPFTAGRVSIHLHPVDAASVREYLLTDVTTHVQSWNIIDDPTMMQGGCKVDTDAVHVDASVEARIAAITAPLFGDERESLS